MPDRPSNFALFWGFTTACICGFGGVLPWVRRMVVDKNGWQTAREFTDLFSLCQFLPGPNIVNFSIIYGHRIHGWAGAAAGATGLIVPPVVLMIVAGMLYSRFGDLPVLRGGLSGLAAAAAGLLIATSVQMAEPLFRKRQVRGILLAGAALVAVGVMQWPLLWVILVLAPISIALSWRALP